MKIEQVLSLLIIDRGTLLNGLDKVMTMMQNDHGITRDTMIKIHNEYREILKNLKYDTARKDVETPVE